VSKPLLKECLMLGLYGLGALRPDKRPAVITYHSFDSTGSRISITPERFREHLSIIKSMGYTTVTASEMTAALKGGGPLPDKAVVLTFDDGLWNNYEVAFPILQEFGFRATIFLVTGYTGRTSTWERDPGIPALPLLTWDRIKEMDRAGMDILPHSVSHPHLTRLPDREIERELTRSRGEIEDRLGREAPVFCYPYGDHDGRVIGHLERLGFHAAFAVRPATEGPFSIARLGSAHLTTGLAYRAALTGSFRHFYSLKKRLKRV
jgi:peptidoglycan/xylan/chitin deacetylase (PgdA/CDA1 family)